MRLVTVLVSFGLWASLGLLVSLAACSSHKHRDPVDAGCEGDACDACASRCADDATCTSDGICVCHDGFTGDGMTCRDIDECADGAVAVCGEGATRCLNAVGSYACFCAEGFAGTGTAACVDLDECATAGAGCSEDPPVACTNHVGSFSCGACPEGFTGDGLTCTDINECVTTTNGGCGDPAFYTCTNTPGSFACSDTDECAIDNGGCDALTTCTNNEGAAPTCGACPEGYRTSWSYADEPWLPAVRVCLPQLSGLSVSPVPMVPTFAPHTIAYRAQVYLTQETVTLTPRAPDGVTITINDEVVSSGAAWRTPTLDIGDNVFEIALSLDDRPITTYRVTVVRSIQEAFIKASNRGTNDFFGESVALSGDTLVVGATGEDSAAVGVDGDQRDAASQYSGAAYVFVRNGHTWTQAAYLKASNTGSRDDFGRAVAIDGDTIVVTAPGEDSAAVGVDGDQLDDTASNAGAAYVFVRNGVTWTQQAYLKASNADAGDGFGTSIAISGDTLVIGATGEDSAATGIDGASDDNSGAQSGAAYVFSRNGVTWTQQAYLKASNADAGDGFGTSIAISGDTIVVGAPWEDSDATGIDGDAANNDAASTGAAYLFVRDGLTWTQHAYLKANTRVSRFGWSVAIDQVTAAVGAPAANKVEVFVRDQAVWSRQATLEDQSLSANSGRGFGDAVGVSGDRIVVGVPYDDRGGSGVNPTTTEPNISDSGRAYVFEREGKTWSRTLLFNAHNPHTNMNFGASVAISADTVAIGGWREASSTNVINGPQTGTGSTDSGAVYVFH